jgi:hypothetical protein
VKREKNSNANQGPSDFLPKSPERGDAEKHDAQFNESAIYVNLLKHKTLLYTDCQLTNLQMHS